MTARQKLGDLIRSIDYSKAKSEGNAGPNSPSTKLKELKKQCKADITFDELKDAYAAFEKKVCIKGFPEAGTQGSDIAYTTLDVIEKLMSKFVEENGHKSEYAWEIRFNTLMALIQAGPNTSHVALLWNFMEDSYGIEAHIQGLEKSDVDQLLKTLKIPFKYTPNNECDEKTFATTLRTRLSDILEMINTEQYELAQREFLDLYLYYNSLMTTLSVRLAKEMYRIVRNMVEKYSDENPYLGLKDPGLIKKHLNVIQEMAYSKNFKKDGPISDAAKNMMERISVAVIRDGMVPELFDHIMDMIIKIYKNENGSKEGGDIVDKVRVYLIREIEERELPLRGIFKSCLNMILAILPKGGELTQDAHLMTEDVIQIVIKKAKPLKEEDAKQVLAVISGLVMSGHRDLVGWIDGILLELKKQRVLDWKKNVDEAKSIIEAIGKAPVKWDKSGAKNHTINCYAHFIEDFFKVLSKSDIVPQIQSSLVTLFFSCVQDKTLIKLQFAETCAHTDYMNLSADKSLRVQVLRNCESMLQDESLPWQKSPLIFAVGNMVKVVANSYNGISVTAEENKIFMSIFTIVSEGGNSVIDHWYQLAYEERPNVNMVIWNGALRSYVDLHQKASTLQCIAPIVPSILRWANIALKEKHENMTNLTMSLLHTIGEAPPAEFKNLIPDLLDLLIKSKKCQDLYNFVNHLYPHDPPAVHSRIPEIFQSLDKSKDNEMSNVAWVLYTVSERHPEAFTNKHIGKIFDRYQKGGQQEKNIMLMIIGNISEKCPSHLVEFFPQLIDAKIFKSDTMGTRSGIIARVGGVNQELGQKAVDYLMKHAMFCEPLTVLVVVSTLSSMVKTHQDYMQQYKSKLEKLEKSSKIPNVKEMVHDMILVLEGKTFENMFEDVQQQKEGMAALDTRVDATVETVITIGDKVIEHDKEIGDLGEGLGKIEERVDDVEEDLGGAKIKIEEIDNKTMSNAPKWSRDLTKLMNPTAENDWRLLASRLGYSKTDARGWATQHDPCMALLSEWYATHKTSEASYGVLTALTEMNRTDGVVIVENAMKAAENVVEDEEFEYTSPPPVFISYQWGFQNEVKLLKQHLNMAGYECWLDVGQMGGGDKLFQKIDNGIRGAKIVICCVTEKYAQSPNCNREVNLAVNLNKPIIPLLMEKTDWPPKGSMGPIFSEYLFIRFFQRGDDETKGNDKRYWPIPKFQELLMQLNFFVVPDQKAVKKEYKNWWAPMTEDIIIDKDRGKKETATNKTEQNKSKTVKVDQTPLVFLSYQWGKQPQVKALYKRLTSQGYTVWMDIYQMGGGDSLYDKIDRGMRGCKAVVSCITEKYSLSANCRREISLADALKKPIIPLLLERMKWPPAGPMSMVFTEMLFINFYRNEASQMTWTGDNFDELMEQLGQYVPDNASVSKSKGNEKPVVLKEKNDSHPKDKGTVVSGIATTKDKRETNKTSDHKITEKVTTSTVDSSKEKKFSVKEVAKPTAQTNDRVAGSAKLKANDTTGNKTDKQDNANVKGKTISKGNAVRAGADKKDTKHDDASHTAKRDFDDVNAASNIFEEKKSEKFNDQSPLKSGLIKTGEETKKINQNGASESSSVSSRPTKGIGTEKDATQKMSVVKKAGPAEDNPKKTDTNLRQTASKSQQTSSKSCTIS